jgi:hypothetical protein
LFTRLLILFVPSVKSITSTLLRQR